MIYSVQGHPQLLSALAKIYSPLTRCTETAFTAWSFAPNRSIEPSDEVIVSVGAYGSLSAAFDSLIRPGDEVIIFDPSFDCYRPMTLACGGIPIHCPLRPIEVSPSQFALTLFHVPTRGCNRSVICS